MKTYLRFLNLNKLHLSVTTVFVCLAFWHIFTLERFPSPFVDDVLTASRVHGYIFTGRAVGPIDGLPISTIEGFWHAYSFLPIVLYSLPFLFGSHLDLFLLRSISLLFGFVVLVAYYRIGKHYGGELLGLITLILVGLSPAFFHAAHLARADIIGIALALCGVVLHLENFKKRALQSFLSGLIIGLAFEFHARSCLYALVIGLLFLQEYQFRTLIKKQFWAFIFGGASGLILYFILHVVPDIEAFKKTTAILFSERTPPLFTFNFDIISHAFVESYWLTKSLYPWSHYIAIIAFVYFLIFGTRQKRSLALFSFFMFLSGTLIVDSKTYFKAIAYTSANDLLLAGFLHELFQLRIKTMSIWSLAMIGIVIGVYGGENIRANATMVRGVPCIKDFEEAGNFLRARIPKNALIMGEETHWFHFQNERYLTWKALRVYQRYSGEKSLAKGFFYFQPEYFISDSQMSVFLADKPTGDPFTDHLRISPKELTSFLEANAKLEDTFMSRCYGDIKVYRFSSWDKE